MYLKLFRKRLTLSQDQFSPASVIHGWYFALILIPGSGLSKEYAGQVVGVG